MRFAKSELHTLLSSGPSVATDPAISAPTAPASSALASSGCPAPAPAPGPAEVLDARGSEIAVESASPARAAPGASPRIVGVLSSAAPRLWAKACAEQATRRGQRERFVELLAWLLGKNGYELVKPARQDYFEGPRVIEGRLALLAQSGATRVAIEVVLEASLPPTYKLLAAKKTGACAVMLCGFADTAAGAHLRLAELTGRPTAHWFHLVCLTPAR